MALTTCPDYGAQISTSANNCPNCGKQFHVVKAFYIAFLLTIMPVAFLIIDAYVNIPAAIFMVVMYLLLPLILKYGK